MLMLIVGLTGAVVLASLAGARRTSTAMDRFRDETLAPDLTVFLPVDNPDTINQLRSLPGVDAVGEARQLMATVDGQFSSAIGGPLDDNIGQTVDRPRVLDGRRPTQIVSTRSRSRTGLAELTGLTTGDSIRMHGFTQAQIDEAIETETSTSIRSGPRSTSAWSGSHARPATSRSRAVVAASSSRRSAFADRFAEQIGSFSSRVLRVRTTGDAAARRFVEAARAETADLGEPGAFQVQPTSETEGAVRDSIDVVAQGLLVLRSSPRWRGSSSSASSFDALSRAASMTWSRCAPWAFRAEIARWRSPWARCPLPSSVRWSRCWARGSHRR